MQASILQRLLVFIVLACAIILGLVVASGFLILALLLIPIFLVRFWIQKKHFEKHLREQQAQYQAAAQQQRNSAGGATIEGEVVKKSESESKNRSD